MGNTLHAYQHVQGIYFPIAAGVFVLILGTLLVLLVGGTRRTKAQGRSHALAVEVAYACLLACVAAFLVWVTFTAETPIDRTVAHPGVRLKVIAAQWSWRFVYADGVSVENIDTWHPTPAYVPTGTEIEVSGVYEDVIHGFWIPELHYQRQFVPGYTTRFDLLFQHSGYYGGECSVLCGVNHSEMHFAMRAINPGRFRQWLAEQLARGDRGS